MTVPEVFPELSGPRVLTMEFFDGVPVDDLTTVARYGYDPAPVVQEVIKGFLLTAIRWGTFHGDVHAGNLLLLPDGRVGVIDWGIVGRLDPRARTSSSARLIEAALGDEDGVARHRPPRQAHVRPGARGEPGHGRRPARGVHAHGAGAGADPALR